MFSESGWRKVEKIQSQTIHSDEGLTLETSVFESFTVANLPYYLTFIMDTTQEKTTRVLSLWVTTLHRESADKLTTNPENLRKVTKCRGATLGYCA